MKRELLLLRHGKAEAFHEHGDFRRELKNKGKRHAQRIAVWLAGRQLIPDHVISSSAERALNTARKCCKAMGLPAQYIQAERDLYLAAPQVLLQRLHGIPDEAQRVLLVGHNPGLEQLLQSLCSSPPPLPPDHNLMPTATLAQLCFDGSWAALQPGQAQLLCLQRGSELPAGFPWPDVHGSELRERPAYYYTQSSAIPFRIVDGQLQVMIVRSSGDKHWVLPKGIVDPGLSPQASALKEAEEEAGVQGEIIGDALGHYDYPKWGASCSVSVFAMQVRRELADDQLEEPQRRRRWVSAATAGMLLKQRVLAPMIEQLQQRLPGLMPCPD